MVIFFERLPRTSEPGSSESNLYEKLVRNIQKAKRDAKAPSVPGAINDDDGDSEKENDNEVAIDTWTAAAAAVWNRW